VCRVRILENTERPITVEFENNSSNLSCGFAKAGPWVLAIIRESIERLKGADNSFRILGRSPFRLEAAIFCTSQHAAIPPLDPVSYLDPMT
jgi:hypothetical protein